MTCIACGETLDPGRTSCPVCRFPVIVSTGNSDEDVEAVAAMGRAWRRQILSGIKVTLPIYHYQFRDGHLVRDHDSEIILYNGSGRETEPGMILWQEQEMFPLKAGQTYSLNAKIKSQISETKKNIEKNSEKIIAKINENNNENTNEKDTAISVQMPKTCGRTKVGLRLETGLKACVVLGDGTQYNCSEMIDLVVPGGETDEQKTVKI